MIETLSLLPLVAIAFGAFDYNKFNDVFDKVLLKIKELIEEWI
jgi:hypothetical protein